MKRRIVLLGRPGSGKGTVAARLEERFKLEHLSTGQWFRREMQQGTKLGERARQYIERGELVPDEIVLGLIEHWLTPEMIEQFKPPPELAEKLKEQRKTFTRRVYQCLYEGLPQADEAAFQSGVVKD